MDKYNLLRLLDDDDVQRKILSIVNAPSEEPKETSAEPPLEDEIRDLKEKLRATFAEKAEALQRAENAERQLNTLRGEKQNLQRELDNTQGKNSNLRNSLSQSEQTTQRLQDKLNEWQKTFNREHQRAQNLQQELNAAQDKISRLEKSITHLRNSVDELNAQLQASFAGGQELFQKYRRVGAHARQLLQGVFPRDDFTSFICGGAQTNSLETLWDVLRECIMSGRQQDSEILWEVFEYCLELVNASKSNVTLHPVDASGVATAESYHRALTTPYSPIPNP